jgi:hypothetical protein
MAKATDFGTCQLCGHKHKLPNGKVAKHGYTVKHYGFFVGTCQGSGHQPYELSCDLLKEHVTLQNEAIDRLQKKYDEEFPIITNPYTIMTVNLTFKQKGRYGSMERTARPVRATPVLIQTPGYSYYQMTPVNNADLDSLVTSYSDRNADPVVLLNYYQDKHRNEVASNIASRRMWIVWAKDRIQKWSLQPLSAVKQAPAGSVQDGVFRRDLNKFELAIMATVKDANDQTKVFNDRREYYVKNVVTYNRVMTLVRDGFLKQLQGGYNKDGNWVQVTLRGV